MKPVDKQAYRSPNQAASDTKRSEKYHAEKEANNGKPPPFKGDESCAFAAPKKSFPKQIMGLYRNSVLIAFQPCPWLRKLKNI